MFAKLLGTKNGLAGRLARATKRGTKQAKPKQATPKQATPKQAKAEQAKSKPPGRDELNKQIHALIAERDYEAAELLLWESLLTSPRAPGTTYTLGLTLLIQEKFEEARPVIDRAYELRQRVKDRVLDRFHDPKMLDCIRVAGQRFPDWRWPEYQLRRERYRGLDVRFGRAVDYLVETGDEKPSFVQIGTNAGNDLLQKSILKWELRGLFVEPQSEPLERLRRRYRDKEGFLYENCAITVEAGPVTLFTDDSRTTLGSLTPDRNLLAENDNPTTMTVEGYTFETVVSRNDIDSFPILQIDTEGYDYNILKQVDLDRYDTQVVRMEFYLLPIEERLASFELFDEYGFAYFFDGMDLVAVRTETFKTLFCLVDYLGASPLQGQ